MAGTPKQIAGLAQLNDLRADFDAVHETLSKILSNIAANPSEPKFRRLRTSNARIAKLFEARGAKQLLLGSGFVEEDDALALPEAADLDLVRLAVDGLATQQAQRTAALQEEERSRKRDVGAAAAKGPQCKASHILLAVGADAPYEALEKRISSWKAQLEDAPHHLMQNEFADLARAHSACPSGARGGALGFFRRGKMAPAVDDVCFDSTKPANKLYGPVRTDDGVHLIWVQSRLEK